MVCATVGSRSCFCWLYRAYPSSAAENITNLILVLTIWWCTCLESSLVLLELYWARRTVMRYSPHPRTKEKPQKEGRRGKFIFRIKPHIHQQCSEGSNKPCVHQDPETPTETETELCLSVSCGGSGQQWTVAEAGALGAADLYGISPLRGGRH